jgi:hypothetical protein
METSGASAVIVGDNVKGGLLVMYSAGRLSVLSVELSNDVDASFSEEGIVSKCLLLLHQSI